MKLNRATRQLARGCLLGLCMPALVAAQTAGPELLLYVPSPDWRDQVIYFVLLDRFNDGDPGNNDQGADEYDPADPRRFSGGDLRGVRAQLDYIQGLGASTVWITPPVANQWWQPASSFSGYHGYWAEHFAQVDAHFGDLAEYQKLSDALHRRGMYLLQDIVVNHTANYFSCSEPAPAGQSCPGYRQLPDSLGRTAPRQAPFDRNDPRRAAYRRTGKAAYHWTPDVRDYTDPQQELNYQMSGLDDLDTENPAVRRALRASYGHWISAVGVDAFRVDTAFYVPPDYFEDFLHADDPVAPGISKVAARTGRRDFLSFGEGFAMDAAFAETAAARIAAYAGPKRLHGMLNFPLYGSLLEVYARGAPTAVLAHRIESAQRLHGAPALWPSFIDNHDVDRYLATGDEAGLRLALLTIFTLPGIPVVYYGTEQGFKQPRASMFAAGWGSAGRDHFDQDAPLYGYIAQLAQLRREQRALSRGIPQLLHANSAGAGALAYVLRDAAHAPVLVVLNSAEHPVLLDHLDTTAPPGARWRSVHAVATAAQDLQTSAAPLHVVLPPRSAQVWLLDAAPAAAHAEPTTDKAAATSLSLGEMRDDGRLPVGGTGPAGMRLHLVVDGNLEQAQAVQIDADGRFTALIDTRSMLDPAVQHQVVAWLPERSSAAPAQPFRVQPKWRLLAQMQDPAGDDHGRDGNYQYPLDDSWRKHRQADIRKIEVYGSAGALRVDVQMASLTRFWNPAMGFDHAALTLFLQLPGSSDGSREMPQQQAQLPAQMRWNLRLRAHGWSNALFSAAGASSASEGTPVTPGATLTTDLSAHLIRFMLPASALGNREDLRGLKLYLNSWDYDGGYRALNPQAGPHSFGGGRADQPLVMDESQVIVIGDD